MSGWRFTGYGRTWSEEKAVGHIQRFLQIMREPATKNAYYIAGAVCVALWFMVLIILPGLLK